VKRVLFISYYFPPMGMGGVQRSAKFVKYLPMYGWEPTVVTVRDVRYHGHDPSLSADVLDSKIIRTESLDPLRILRALKPSGGKQRPAQQAGFSALDKWNGILTRWIYIPDSKIPWIPFAVHAAMRAGARVPFDAVFTTSPPHSAHLAGLLLRKMLRVPWTADFRDSWLMEKFDRVPTRFHRRINDRMLRAVLSHADRIVGISEPIVADLRKISGREADAFKCISNGFDSADFRGTGRTRSHFFRVTYCGTANTVHSPECFFRGFQRALLRRPDLRESIRVRFVGSVTGIDFRRMVVDCGLAGLVTGTGYVSHAESIVRLMDSDLLLLLLPSDSSPGVLTGKIFEYLASGIPILGVIPEGEASRLIRSNPQNASASPDDPDAVAGALIGLYDRWKQGGVKIIPAPAAQAAPYDRKRQSGMLAAVLEESLPGFKH
jgi:glycosyltransferase involved in cell wall biosynthesis